VALPVWLKLVRSGNTFSGYLSTDGSTWTQVGTNQTVTMAANVYIGLAVNSATNSALATATFDNVSISSTPANSLPAPWLHQDVGQIGVAGSATYGNGTFAVQGSGAQVWDTADGIHFVYQPLSGNGTIVARLLTLQGGTSVESAGLMVRETLTAGSTNVYTGLGNQSLIYFDERVTTGGLTTSQSTVSPVALPIWLKLARSGNTFSGYLSNDGLNWTQVGTSQTVSMAANVYIGLAVNSATNSALATATFDNVSVTAP
jgi:beta-xylosidase